MKASLQLKMGQSLTMTPQLQQAIRLLQLSTLDLQQEIQQALDDNPLLEITEEEITQDGNEAANPIEPDAPETASISEPEPAPELSEVSDPESDWDAKIPDELPVDSSWEDTYQSTSSTSSSSASSDDDYDFEGRNGSSDSLQDHLLWQLNLTQMTDRDRLIAMTIIDGVNDEGYLSIELDDVIDGVNHDVDEEVGEDLVELDEVQAVLNLLQQFEPAGVCARDLKDCLLIQLKQMPIETEWLEEAKHVVSEYLLLLGSRDYATLMRKSKLKEDELKSVIDLIQELNPRPGSMIESEQAEYVIPDVIVTKKSDRWMVELNPDIAPNLRVNSQYASMVKRADNSADNTYLKDNLQEAKWFIKSLQSRNETLLKVATKIVEHQRGFLDYGDEAMKPLVLHDIAEAVGMHESTISRVTTQKYMHTPGGIFELKYFFSSHVSTAAGGECSSTAIRAMIKKLIANEAPKKPLSDNKLATLLADDGINVARRTVAKYREAMHIAPSNERKRLV
jgi:RNA polymerase sigma-54 factor